MTPVLACTYLRVSTSQQHLHDLSIPDQRNQIRAYADEKGWQIVAEFEERGASARDDQRPVLQEMMAQGLMKPPPFTQILFHSMSRLFRDEVLWETYRRRLDKNGVKLVSITQDFGEGTAGDLTRRIMAISDELNSLENAKHVRRTMAENARQGFWNGSTPPLGYRIVVAEIRGHKQKKKLEIDPEGAEIVRLIYRLYLEGDGENGPLGIKNTVRYLNENGFRSRRGHQFAVSYVEKILKHEGYYGRYPYNVRDTVRGVKRPAAEHITIEIPPIISEEEFRRVQAQLLLRSPAVTPPRRVNSPVLLSGIAKCAGCGGLMHRVTGKGGRYRYYKCSRRSRTGNCPADNTTIVNADVLDQAVMARITDFLLQPLRVQQLVEEVARKRREGGDQALSDLRRLSEQRVKVNKKIANLMNALAEGVVEATQTFKDTMQASEAELVRLDGVIASQQQRLATQIVSITLEQAEEIAATLKDKLMSGSSTQRRRLVQSFVKEVVIGGEEITIVGQNADLAEVVTGSLKNAK